VTAPADKVGLSPLELQRIAWQFLGSEFAGENYRDWSIDRRLDAYLLHHRLMRVVEDTTAYNALMDLVMSSVGAALRSGLLESPAARRNGQRVRLAAPGAASPSAATKPPSKAMP
jgi:hypothetical protein